MNKAEYELLARDATQITVAFTQQAVLPENGFNNGKDFGKFWADCLDQMVAGYEKRQFTKRINPPIRDEFGNRIPEF